MDNDTEAPKDPGVLSQRYTEQDYEGMENDKKIKTIFERYHNFNFCFSTRPSGTLSICGCTYAK